MIEPIWWHVPLAIVCMVSLSLVVGFLALCVYYLSISSAIIIKIRKDEINGKTTSKI